MDVAGSVPGVSEPAPQRTDAPEMAPWNLALRFVVELGSLIGLGVGAWTVGSSAAGPGGGALGLLVPIVGAVAWGTFNVEGDPSRSGRAPVPVSGGVRLAIEILIFLAGATGWMAAGRPAVALALLTAAAVTSIVAHERTRWLLAN